MALDRQRILGELGSVMKQLQSADCGCLGKLFGGPQQTKQPMGRPLPTCRGCRRACCCGHGYGNYNQPTPISQTAQNMNPTQLDYANNPQQAMSGNMYGMGPQIVNMMSGDNYKPQSTPVQGQGSMVIDAPQSPHGKVGLTPFNPTDTPQQGQFNSPSMNQAGVTGQFTQPSSQANMPNMMPWTQQNMTTAHQMATPQTNPHGQHSQGIAKFNQMFPGVKQGLGGNLGFDPMAIAIQMNPDNHLQSAMDTMHKIMNDNRGMDKTLNNPAIAQPGIETNSNVSPNPLQTNATMQQQLAPNAMTQNRVNPVTNEQMHNIQNVTDQIPPVSQETANMGKQAKYQQPQQVYSAAVEPTSVNQERLHDGDARQMPDQNQYQQQYGQQQYGQQQYGQQQYGQQQMMDINAGPPNLPAAYHETADNSQEQPSPIEPDNYTNQQRAPEMIKEPIFPADSSRNMVYMPSKVRRNYGYNTLGQPVEMLPAKMYHPAEPSLPQTLSPQANPVKPRQNAPKAMKATISRTSLTGNKPVGRNPSRGQLQHIYNQYKGSHSFTQQNVRQPGEGTYSDGRLNVPQGNITKVSAVPVERVGGDTIVNNPPPNQVPIQKVEQVMSQIGDVPVNKPVGDTSPIKEAPGQMKKCRNGLQDMVFSSYPTSTAWTFHGHGPKDYSLPDYRYRSQQY